MSPPAGFQKVLRLQLAADGVITSVAPAGVATSVADATGTITCDYIATMLQSETLLTNQATMMHVQRSTEWTFQPGSVVHELRDHDGRVFTFFGVDVTMLETTGIDYEELGAFETMPIPAGWSYSSRVLEERLVLNVTDVAVVYNQLRHSLWELSAGTTPSPVDPICDDEACCISCQ